MSSKPPSDPSKPPLGRKSSDSASDQYKIHSDAPILAARPSRSRLKAESGAQEFASLDINEEMIRQRAYELWEQRGRLDGFQEEDWRRAEAELRGDLQQAS